MTRKQMNIRLDELTRETIKRIAERWNMSESQVITRGVVLLEQELRKSSTSLSNQKITDKITDNDDLSDGGEQDIPH